MRHAIARLCGSFLCALPLVAQGQVWIVDAAGGAGSHFTTLVAAADAAADGDTLVVRKGGYVAFPFGQKSLRVIADTGADVSVASYVFAPPMVVGDQPAGGTTLIRGLRFVAAITGPDPTDHAPYSLRLEHGQGTVWLESCTFVNGNVAAIVVDGAGDVVLKDCVAAGFPGRPALRANAGRFTIFGGRFTGGEGLAGGTFGTSGGHGAPAIRLVTGELNLSDTLVSGGKGGQPGYAGGNCNEPGDGGAGVLAEIGLVRVRDAVLQGGGGGSPVIAGCTWGDAGPPIALQSAALETLNGLSSALDSDSPVREGQTLTLRLTAELGGPRTALLLASQTVSPAFAAPLTGMNLLGGPTRRIELGTIDPATGIATFSFTVPELGAGVLAAPWIFQAYVCSAGVCSVGGATHTLWLDASL